ncbi:MAG TPA: DUF429 domain-containing protein [Thermoanaerobaculia bacterium]|nr:DUF429 domain-containing protein [Thermoanaerobaculia bacterium]
MLKTILALDAAWTATEPSGVALVQGDHAEWRCLTVAPSYDEFFAQAGGLQTDWSSKKFAGALPDVPRLLSAARSLAGRPVDLITVDMPMATVSFSSRRAADIAVSVEFGSRWCSTHTPSLTRPGPLGAKLSSAAQASGYKLATVATQAAEVNRLVEVYPHPALLSLLQRDRRVSYKVGKSGRYWPDLDRTDRIHALLGVFNSIYRALEKVFGPLGFDVPAPEDIPALAHLKRYEDALDALACAWVGVEYLKGRTVALGDETAAIWCPADVVHG